MARAGPVQVCGGNPEGVRRSHVIHTGLKGPISVPKQDGNGTQGAVLARKGAVLAGHGEVQVAVSVEVADSDVVWRRPHRILDLRLESAIAVSEQPKEVN